MGENQATMDWNILGETRERLEDISKNTSKVLESREKKLRILEQKAEIRNLEYERAEKELDMAEKYLDRFESLISKFESQIDQSSIQPGRLENSFTDSIRAKCITRLRYLKEKCPESNENYDNTSDMETIHQFFKVFMSYSQRYNQLNRIALSNNYFRPEDEYSDSNDAEAN